MAELLTQPHSGSVDKFIAAIADDQKRADARAVLALMRELSGAEPRMWGSSIVGFDSYHYVYESGREGDWFVAGFSPRAANLTLYIMSGFAEEQALLERLGKHKIGKSCLYVKRLADIDEQVLRELVTRSIAFIRSRYAPTGGEPAKPAATKSAAKKPAKKSAKKPAAAKKPAKTPAKKSAGKRA
jgi:hypothetical protein